MRRVYDKSKDELTILGYQAGLGYQYTLTFGGIKIVYDHEDRIREIVIPNAHISAGLSPSDLELMAKYVEPKLKDQRVTLDRISAGHGGAYDHGDDDGSDR